MNGPMPKATNRHDLLQAATLQSSGMRVLIRIGKASSHSVRGYGGTRQLPKATEASGNFGWNN